MLLGLGHPALVGGYDEQGDVDRLDPGQHVLEEPLMTGHIDERDLADWLDRGPGEPEIDGQPAFLLLGPAIGVTPGQGLDQGRLAVIDVAGGPDQRQPATMSAITSSSSTATARRSMIRSLSIRRVRTGWVASRRRPWRWSSSSRTICGVGMPTPGRLPAPMTDSPGRAAPPTREARSSTLAASSVSVSVSHVPDRDLMRFPAGVCLEGRSQGGFGHGVDPQGSGQRVAAGAGPPGRPSRR